MKLTNYIRDSFVNAVKHDIPEVKWPDLETTQALCVKAMSPKVRAVYKDEDTRKALNTEYYYINGIGGRRLVVGDVSVREVLDAFYEQEDTRNTALGKVRSAANACNTLKQLQEMLPELTAYMPSEKGPAPKNLPRVQGVVTALTDAGFPKGK